LAIAFVQQATRQGVATGQAAGVQLAPAPVAGHLLIAQFTARGNPNPANDPVGFTRIGAAIASPSDGLVLAYRVAQAGDPAAVYFNAGGASEMTVLELAGTAVVAPLLVTTRSGPTAGDNPTCAITPAAGLNAVVVAGLINSDNGAGGVCGSWTPGAGYNLAGQAQDGSGHPLGGLIYQVVAATVGTYNPNAAGVGGGGSNQSAEIAAVFGPVGGATFYGEPGGGVW
jgi:hypothetical protein